VRKALDFKNDDVLSYCHSQDELKYTIRNLNSRSDFKPTPFKNHHSMGFEC
jgi:hypothetical protein